MIIKICFVITCSICLVACDNNRKTEYFESGNIKTIWHESEGEKHGKLVAYYEDGQVRKVQNWIQGALHGKETAYHGNGNIAQIFQYNYGIKIDTAYLYRPSAELIEIQYFDSLGNKLNFERYNEEGQRSNKLMGILNSKKDTIFENEVYEVTVRLGNISNKYYNTGKLILTSGWTQNGYLLDTLDISLSDNNFYKLQVEPKNTGTNEIYMCLFYEIPLDMIDGTLHDRYCYEKQYYVVKRSH